nr:hypothetical protein [Roseococcus pinisoli]
MPTGDGLLLRAPAGDWSPAVVRTIAKVAAGHGNGVVEVSARGNLQLRGFRAETVAEAAAMLAAVGLVDAPPVMRGPLAGQDPAEIAGPRAIVAQIAARWPEGLAPKTSVVVDGGGLLPLDAVGADLRLVAISGDAWLLGLGGRGRPRWQECVPTQDAADAILGWLARLGPRRAREVEAEAPLEPPAPRPAAEPLGWHAAAGALGLAGAFGALEAEDLAALAEALPAGALLRPAPGRAWLVLGLADEEAVALRDRAAGIGLVTDPADPRRRIVACPGRPSCASAEAETRGLARELAALPGLPGLVHLSGCAKGCAHPGPAPVTLVGRGGGFDLIRAGGPRDLAACRLAPGEVAAAIRNR